MLVLSRKPGERIFIDSQITVTVIEVKGNRVRIGIDAPDEIPVVRAELNAFLMPSIDNAPDGSPRPIEGRT